MIIAQKSIRMNGRRLTEQLLYRLLHGLDHHGIQPFIDQRPNLIHPAKSTVYRLVAEMATQGHLRRFPKTDGGRGWLYQYHEKHNCDGHLHLKCAACGMLLHLECGMSNELLAHIENTHGFQVDNTATVLYGLCAECRKEEKLEKTV